MGWWDRFMFRNWPRPKSQPALSLDLAAPALGSIRLTSPAAAARELLGAPASWSYYKDLRLWIYPELGVTISVDEDRVVAFGATPLRPEYHYTPSLTRQFEPFSGPITTTGGDAKPGSEWTEAYARELLGEPSERDEDQYEVVLMYERSNWGMDLEYTLEGQLAHIEVYAWAPETGAETGDGS